MYFGPWDLYPSTLLGSLTQIFEIKVSQIIWALQRGSSEAKSTLVVRASLMLRQSQPHA